MKRFVLTILVAFIALSTSAQQWGHTIYGNGYQANRISSDGALSKGYRSMIELYQGFCAHMDYANLLTYVGGYQYNPYFFLGGFAGGGYLSCGDDFWMQVGADFRTYLGKGRNVPFLGLKYGYQLVDDESLMLVGGQLGMRHAIRNGKGISYGIQATCDFDDSYILFKVAFEF